MSSLAAGRICIGGPTYFVAKPQVAAAADSTAGAADQRQPSVPDSAIEYPGALPFALVLLRIIIIAWAFSNVVVLRRCCVAVRS